MPTTFTVNQAVLQSDQLRNVLHLARESEARLHCIRQILPLELGQQLKFGSLQDAQWTLLVPHQASFIKLKQRLPQLIAHLNNAGLYTQEIKLKLIRNP